MERDLAQRAFAAIADLKHATSLEELNRTVAPIYAGLGFPWFATASFFTADQRPRTRLLFGQFQSDWANRYVQRNYSRSSTIAKEMLRTSELYSWQGVLRRRGIEEEQAQIWNEARDFGLQDGLFVPLRWLDGGYAAVVLGGPEPYSHDPLARAIAEVLSSYYAQNGRRLTTGADQAVRLAPRQLECLRWVSAGKSSSDIADILGLSSTTVDSYISSACVRLGVRTRTQAAVEAALRGLIAL